MRMAVCAFILCAMEYPPSLERWSALRWYRKGEGCILPMGEVKLMICEYFVNIQMDEN